MSPEPWGFSGHFCARHMSSNVANRAVAFSLPFAVEDPKSDSGWEWRRVGTVLREVAGMAWDRA